MTDTDALLAQIPTQILVEELRRRQIDFDLSSVPGRSLGREMVRRRKSRPVGRPAHPMRERIVAERAAGAPLRDLAWRHNLSIRSITRIVRTSPTKKHPSSSFSLENKFEGQLRGAGSADLVQSAQAS